MFKHEPISKYHTWNKENIAWKQTWLIEMNLSLIIFSIHLCYCKLSLSVYFLFFSSSENSFIVEIPIFVIDFDLNLSLALYNRFIAPSEYRILKHCQISFLFYFRVHYILRSLFVLNKWRCVNLMKKHFRKFHCFGRLCSWIIFPGSCYLAQKVVFVQFAQG